jgi:mono/diheme cytochrome c family protein
LKRNNNYLHANKVSLTWSFGIGAGLLLVSGGFMATTAVSQTQRPEVAAGAKTYEAVCSGCHEHGGDQHANALDGERFLSAWSGKPARALYARILSTMPQSDPGSLESKQVLQLTAYILSRNGQALPEAALTAATQLNSIVINK